MPLSTFVTCTRCAREVEISDLPAPLFADVLARGSLCGRCGARQLLVRLWPAVLAMPVTTERARMSLRRGVA